jgi:hypothetical protein
MDASGRRAHDQGAPHLLTSTQLSCFRHRWHELLAAANATINASYCIVSDQATGSMDCAVAAAVIAVVAAAAVTAAAGDTHTNAM